MRSRPTPVTPDLSFEIVCASATDDERVVGEWVMRDTNTGLFSLPR
jgi:hypothetical protein